MFEDEKINVTRGSYNTNNSADYKIPNNAPGEWFGSKNLSFNPENPFGHSYSGAKTTATTGTVPTFDKAYLQAKNSASPPPQNNNQTAAPTVSTTKPTNPALPVIPQSNPENSAVVQGMLPGSSYASAITQQATTDFGQQPSLPSVKIAEAPSASPATPTIGQKPLGSGTNDMSMTDSLKRALGDTQQSVAIAQGLSGSPIKTPALPNVPDPLAQYNQTAIVLGRTPPKQSLYQKTLSDDPFR